MKDFYERFCDWLAIHPITTGGILAVILTALRVAMSETDKSFGYVCMEGLACGLLSTAFSYAAINMMDLDNSVGVLIGSSAGFVGIDRLRILFIKLIDIYLGTKSKKVSDSHTDSNRGKTDE